MEFKRYPATQRTPAKIPLPPREQSLEEEEDLIDVVDTLGSSADQDRPFLDIAQFFLDEEEEQTNNNDGNQLVSDVIDLKHAVAVTGGVLKAFSNTQVQDLYLFDENKTFVPIVSTVGVEGDDEDGLRQELLGCPSVFNDCNDADEIAQELMLVGDRHNVSMEDADSSMIKAEDFLGGFPGDDLLLAGEGDLFIDEANFFCTEGEMDERERETPSPANVDTEKEDEGEEGEEAIRMEDKARTISPFQLHEPSAVTSDSKTSGKPEPSALTDKESDKLASQAAATARVIKPTTETSNTTRASRKRSLTCVSGTKADQKRTKRKRKTPEQLAVLEREFDANPMPNKEVRDQLSARLGLTSRQVQIWFQNKRAKVKNNGGGATSAPPTPHQSPTTSRAASPLLMLGQTAQGKTKTAIAPAGLRLIPPAFSPENFAAAAAAAGHPHPIALPPHAFLDLLSARGVNHLIASLATLTPQQQQQALAEMPGLLSATHLSSAPVLTPIAPAPPAPAPVPSPVLSTDNNMALVSTAV